MERCMKTCRDCIKMFLSKNELNKSMMKCLSLCNECEKINNCCCSIMCMNGISQKHLFKACIDICKKCRDECKKHNNQSCKKCAIECNKCIIFCNKKLKSL